MKIFTIGFTRKSAETFFTRLTDSGASALIDVRLNNVSQLAAFAKRDDLAYFLKTICGISYAHSLELAPTAEILDPYKKNKTCWDTYERQFLELMQSRQIERTLDAAQLDNACLLCSEETPHHCHRRLVAEYLQKHWPNVEIHHIP